MTLKEFGPYFFAPKLADVNGWLSLNKSLTKKIISKRELEILTALRYLVINETYTKSSKIAASQLVDYVCSKRDGDLDKNTETAKVRLRKSVRSLLLKNILDREKYAHPKNHRSTFIYKICDPDEFFPTIENSSVHSSTKFNEKIRSYQVARREYESRSDVLLISSRNSSEPWITKLITSLLCCCRESSKDPREMITMHTKLQGEDVRITSKAPAGELMIKADARYLTALLTLNVQSLFDSCDYSLNRYAVDINDIIKLCGHQNPAGGHRRSAWASISRLRSTSWEISLDPAGELAKTLAAASGGEPRDTIGIQLMNNVLTGIDTLESAGAKNENRTPRFIEYGLGEVLRNGLINNREGMVVHPNLLFETNGNVMFLYYWLRTTLSPNQNLVINSHQLMQFLGTTSSYNHFNDSLINGLLKHAASPVFSSLKKKDLKAGDRVEVDLYDFKIVFNLKKPEFFQAPRMSYDIEWEFISPMKLKAELITRKRYDESVFISNNPNITYQRKLL